MIVTQVNQDKLLHLNSFNNFVTPIDNKFSIKF